MKKITFLFYFLFQLSGFAQTGSYPAGGGNKNGIPDLKNAKNMNIGRFYGKIVDAKTKKPVEYASVVLLWFNKDSLIAGGLAKENGDFSLENLPPYGGYRFRASFIGYKTFETKV